MLFVGLVPIFSGLVELGFNGIASVMFLGISTLVLELVSCLTAFGLDSANNNTLAQIGVYLFWMSAVIVVSGILAMIGGGTNYAIHVGLFLCVVSLISWVLALLRR